MIDEFLLERYFGSVNEMATFKEVVVIDDYITVFNMHFWYTRKWSKENIWNKSLPIDSSAAYWRAPVIDVVEDLL